jgi:conjugal transfer mating pair stabilization protein TraG
MSQAMHVAGASGAGNVDVFAQTRADIQTERTYASIAENAMKWVPLLNVVLTVVFYAMFPVIFPLFLLPKTGPLALRGYVTGFFYLAAWGPLFVILHMMLMFKGATRHERGRWNNGSEPRELHRHGRREPRYRAARRLSHRLGAVPGRRRRQGRDGDFGHATSYLNPSQNAAEEAAREASTGNVSLGNSSLDNSTVLLAPVRARRARPSFTYGAAQTRGNIQRHRLQTTSFPKPELATSSRTRSYPFTPTLGPGVHRAPLDHGSQAAAKSETYSNLAQQSTSSAVTKFRDPQCLQPGSILRERQRHRQLRQHPARPSARSTRPPPTCSASSACRVGPPTTSPSPGSCDGEAGASAGVTNGVLGANVGAKGRA